MTPARAATTTDATLAGRVVADGTNTAYDSQATRFQIAPGNERTINVGLAVGSVLTGRLTDSRNGTVLRGVNVEAEIPGTFLYEPGATSGADGVYKITGLAAGTYHVRFGPFPADSSWTPDMYDVAAARGVTVYPQQSHRQRFPNALTLEDPYDPVAVGRSATVTLDEPLVQGGTISGRVTRAGDGVALPGVCVEAYVPGWMRSPSPYEVDVHALVTTDANGRYSIKGLRPGNDYIVLFNGANLNSTVSPAVPCPSAWQTKWWSNATSEATATRIHITPYVTVANVNGSLKPR
jgi:hypothetical protein